MVVKVLTLLLEGGGPFSRGEKMVLCQILGC